MLDEYNNMKGELMASLTKMLVVCFILTFAAGCVKFSVTPVVSTIQLVPSDIPKSRLLGQTCGSGNYFTGGEGKLGIQEILEKNKGSKVTFVDYSLDAGLFGATVCMSVYGY